MSAGHDRQSFQLWMRKNNNKIAMANLKYSLSYWVDK